MDDKKIKIMVVLLSFQSGRNQEWCEKFLDGTVTQLSKTPPESKSSVARETAYREKVKYLNTYADKILSIVKA